MTRIHITIESPLGTTEFDFDERMPLQSVGNPGGSIERTERRKHLADLIDRATAAIRATYGVKP